MPFTDSINMVDVVIADKGVLSATPNDVVSGKMFIGKNQKLESGSIPINPKRPDTVLSFGERIGIPYGINPVPYNIEVESLTDATPSNADTFDILMNKTAWVNGLKVTGTMPNMKNHSAEIAAGESHRIPQGFHDGSGYIKAKSLASQTKAMFSPDHLKKGDSAWANGQYVEGTMKDNADIHHTLSGGESFVIPAGYHNGKGTINTLTVAEQTAGTAHDKVIADGYVAWVNGKRVTGTMPTNSDKEIVFPVNGEYIIPNGYHTGFGKITQNVPHKAGMTIAPSKEIQILDVGGYFMDGNITVTGVNGLNYKRCSEGEVSKDSTGKGINNYWLPVGNNKASIIIYTDNWHDNNTLNIYQIKSSNIVDSSGKLIKNFNVLVMVDYIKYTPRTYMFDSISVTTRLDSESNAQIIEFNNIKSGNVTIFEPFSARGAVEGVSSSDILAVAKSLLGKNEADGSFKYIIDTYNSHEPLAVGYTVKYTDDWCDAFVSCVAILANAVDLIGTECGCPRHVTIWQNKGIWIEDGSVIPHPGDIIVYNWDDKTQPNDGNADHVGYVYSVEGNTITTIEGNIRGGTSTPGVRYREIPVGYGQIRGFARPRYVDYYV